MSGTGYSLGEFTANKASEHVVIHAVVDSKGGLLLPDGQPLPKLRPGSTVQVRTLALSLMDPKLRASLITAELRELLPANALLLAVVDLRCLGDERLVDRLRERGVIHAAEDAVYRAHQLKDRMPYRLNPYDGLLEVRLVEPLLMERKGEKSSRLRPCRCQIPTLPSDDGPEYSLNHALTRISEALELTRISHTGNVFQRYMVMNHAGPAARWIKLGDRRDLVEARPRLEGALPRGAAAVA